MTSFVLNDKLQPLGEDLRVSAALAAAAIANATTLLGGNGETSMTARMLIRNIERLDSKCFDAKRAAMAVLATQPVQQGDRRFLTSIPDICLEISRISRYSWSMAELAARRDPLETPALLACFQDMALQAANFLRRAVGAFVDQDLQAARMVATEIALLDSLYDEIYYESLDTIAAEPASAQRARLLLTAAHNLQCIGRHIKHMCEDTIFVETGDWPKTPYIRADELLAAVQ